MKQIIVKTAEIVALEKAGEQKFTLEEEARHRAETVVELNAEEQRLLSSGKCDDADTIQRLCTITTRRSLIPARRRQIEEELFALAEGVRESVLAPRLQVEKMATALLVPHRDSLMAECERVIAPLVSNREQRTELAARIFDASEKGAAINRLFYVNDKLGTAPTLEAVCSGILAHFDALGRFEQKYPAA